MSMVVDFETYSSVDIGAGVYKYMRQPDADIVCLAYKLKGGSTQLWWPGDPIPDCWHDVHMMYAHNAGFDEQAWNVLGVRKYGFPPIHLARWCDTAAMSRRYSLPSSLAGVGDVLNLEVQKDKRGRALMRKISFPKADGTRPRLGVDYTNQDLQDYGNYCVDDVNTTYHLVKNLPSDKLAPNEQKLWEMTVKMNQRGLPVDREVIDRITSYIGGYVEDMTLRVPEITDNAVAKVTQTQKMVKWITDQGVNIPNLQALTVENLLKQDLPKDVHELLILRQTLARSSTAKYRKLQLMEHHGRIYDNLLYYGTGTGRWSGAGFQLHNLPRASVADPDYYIDRFNKFLSVEDPVNMAKALIRSMIHPRDGKVLLVSDYAAIENRLIMWLAEEHEVLTSIREGRDQYIEMAAYMYQDTYHDLSVGYIAGDKLSCHKRRIGKIIVLGCGFQMGGKRFRESAAEQGVVLSEGESFSAVNAFRTKHARLKKMWKKLSDCCIAAIQSPGRVYVYNSCSFRVVKCRAGNIYLVITPPSGRSLYYFSPYLRDGQYGPEPGHYGISPYTKKWSRKSLIPGRITENIIQALARDIMAHGLQEVEKQMPEVDLLGSVHDEVIGEVLKQSITDTTLVKFNDCLCALPVWAEGLPLKAEGWIGPRYKKG